MTPPEIARSTETAPANEMAAVLRGNIRKLTELRRQSSSRRDLSTRIADAVTAFAGSMRSVVFHLTLFGGWVILNLGLVPGVRPFDPFPFVMLAMLASCEAIFLSTFVLVSQKRAADLSRQRDELDVQMSLMAEHEITRLIQMVDALMLHLQVPSRLPDVEALKRDVAPEEVVREIAKVEERARAR